jgi:hypothetical protein
MYNDIQRNVIQHNDTYRRVLLCRVSFMLSIIYEAFMFSIIMLNVVMLRVATFISYSRKKFSSCCPDRGKPMR